MNEVYQWVINLLVLVVLMALSDLLVPSQAWRPFIRLALGGLLLLLLLEPLFYFFQNEEKVLQLPFSQLEQSVYEEQQQNQRLIQDMNDKHQSYIWNEVSDKLARQADPIVQEKFNVKLGNVVVWPHDSSIEEFRGEVEVELIGLTELSSDVEEQLLLLLATEWGVPSEAIKITRVGE
ncbi:stage III sporulation protein AF [Jeotgalibacillus proteolyticus]|uniref:Stage III sporulation protein AF n=1 Tax=Jeotgalibacillus proteolyticus TaxID=2082395 RepID=A0A2S5GEN6_9BACL|nr:stage III sporulation protein AF [Jeotgalibacillus proteolyticus]PPA71375.1 hypothetical protein C4B60_04745 [Jeotgalibacillus proteolyticus]